MTSVGKYVPITVEQIAKDTITQIASRYWLKQDSDSVLETYDPNLIEDIYSNELLKSNFSLKRIMLLEFSQYLENYLWKNFKSENATISHILSIVIMVNEKFRERVFAWDCFKNENSNEFSNFFDKVLKITLLKFNGSSIKLSYQEQSMLVKFIDNCVNSLEIDIIRLQVQKICGLPMWVSLNENRREHEFKKFTKLRKFWRALEKNDSKLNESDKERVLFERTFLKMLIDNFLNILQSFNSAQMESGELIDESIERKYKLHYMERFLELLIDLEALLPTRRFFNTLLDDTNLLIHCYLSDLIKLDDKYDEYKLFRELFQILKFYSTFEIDDQSGEAKTDNEVEELHYEKLKSLQKGIFKYYRDELQSFSLTNIATIDKRDTLIKHLNSLSFDLIHSVAVYLNLVPEKSKENYSKELLIEIIIWHMERPASQLEELNSLPLFPTEDIIWNENLVPSDNKRNLSSIDQCLALPKLNLQFLTLHDYLLRNFNLFRLESAYELRQDIEDACVRLKPYYSYEEQAVAFKSWSRMAQPIQNFTIIEVAKPFVGEQAPSRVRVDITLDLECLREDVRNEWNSLRKHDIAFLVALKPNNTPEQHYNPNESFIQQVGLQYVRGCEIEGILNDEGKLIGEDVPISKNNNNDTNKVKFSSHIRTYRVILDSNQYKIDHDKLSNQTIKDDLYNTFNVFVRRRPKENNFKAILESIRDLINTNFVVPEWLRDLILGYGDPNSANYRHIKNPSPIASLNFNDTFISFDHLKESFPDYQLELINPSEECDNLKPPFKLTFCDLIKSNDADENNKLIKVQPYKPLNRGPYPFEQPKVNQVKFTPTQIEAIKSGMQPGLTIVVGPPGTGKTDVAVQIISNIYHNFPDQKTLIVTHSNQALNQLFEKIMALDIDERHLLRLGHGEEGLETEKDFSRYGRVNYVLAKRLQILDEVDRLQKSHVDFAICGDSVAYSCETAVHFYLNFVLPKWQIYTEKMKKIMDDNKNLNNSIESIQELFPFTQFFSNAPQPIFKKQSFIEDYEIAKGCFRYIKKLFKQLEEFRAFELIRNGADRAQYLLVKEAKIIAMTCTHAALKRRDLVKWNFKYDNILMEEAAQILEIETFIPLLLQNPDHNGNNRLKRWIMIGDHHQLPPVIKNITFQKYSNMEQSLFTRFVKLGIPTVDLDAQGRCRASLCDLFRWRYKNLGSLSHVNERDEFKFANAGLKYDYQFINVDDFNGQGESEPQPFYYQNLAEAEFAVGLFMYMRLLGYPADLITILSTYNGQKHLIRDVLKKRCMSNPLIGYPKKITTVDKYQGQQNDFIIISLVRTKTVGHLRDVRRLIVALSRARLGLYIFGRAQLFKSCFELTPALNILLKRPVKLELVLNELYPSKRMLTEESSDNVKTIESMQEMVQLVYDFYQSKLKAWQNSKNQNVKLSKEERLKKLNEEERVIREKLNEAIERSEYKHGTRLNIGKSFEEYGSSSSSSSSEDEDNVETTNNEMNSTNEELKEEIDSNKIQEDQ